MAKADLVVISPEKMNVLYIGLDNPIKIAISGIDSKNITATINQGELIRTSDVNWIAKVDSQGKALIKVFADNDGKIELYATKEFRIKKLPSPVVMLAGRRYNFIERKMIVTSPYLMADLEDYMLYGVAFYIQSFTFTISNGTHNSEVKCTGFMLPQNVLELIKKANDRDLITFSDIKVKFPDGSIRQVDDLNLILK
ncbi:MAG: GldM family protein [Bacteroidota bacterium]